MVDSPCLRVSPVLALHHNKVHNRQSHQMASRNYPTSGTFGDVSMLLDSEAKRSLQKLEDQPDSWKRNIARITARGTSIEELIHLCDLTTSHTELPGMVFPSYAIYSNGLVRAYVPTQYAQHDPSFYTISAQKAAQARGISDDKARPAMLQHVRATRGGSQADIQSLYGDRKETIIPILNWDGPEAEAARAYYAEVRCKASLQPVKGGDCKRTSRSTSVSSSRSVLNKAQGRRGSTASSLSSFSTTPSKATCIKKL